MSKTFMTMIIVSGLVILFVFSRWFSGTDTASFWGNSTALKEKEFQSWVVYTPDTEIFTAKFPRKPQETSFSSNEIPNFRKHYINYAADGIDKVIFMVQEISYEKTDKSSKSNLLENILYDIVSSTQATLLDSQEIEFQENKALKFETEKGERKTFGILFKKGDKIYILSKTIDLDGDKENDDFNYFMNSFKFNK